MDNENNKVSLEKNDSEVNNNEMNASLSQNDNYGQQTAQNNESENIYNGNFYQEQPYNSNGVNQNTGDFNGANSYQSNPYGMNGQKPSKSTFSPSGFSIASLVLGILSIVCCCAWYISGIFGILGLVFSIIVLVKKKPGKGMAIAGLICSAIGIIMAVILLIMVFVVGTSMTADDYSKIIDQINSME